MVGIYRVIVQSLTTAPEGKSRSQATAKKRKKAVWPARVPAGIVVGHNLRTIVKLTA